MANDDIAFVSRHDEIILRYGEKLYGKVGNQAHQYQYVKKKLRELGCYLIAARKCNPKIHTIQDTMNPLLFPSVIAAVKDVTGFDPSTGQYKVPSLALKLGHSLKHCGKILLTKAIVSGKQMLKQSAEEFMTLCTEEWSSEVSSLALQNLHTRKFNNPRRLPVAADLQKLNRYLEDIAAHELKELQEMPNQRAWRNLASATLAQLVLFNRRRGGKTERMELKQYMKGIMSNQEMQEEIEQCLSPFEKNLAQSLRRVEIRGKRGRRVPVLLTNKHLNQLEAICKTRKECGVLDSNRFVFAREGNAQSPLRSSDVLKKICHRKWCKNPELISSTSLRKHVATISQILSLKDNELDSLANFLGHDVSIHREFYRLPDDTIQLAKISKLLLEVENGTISQHTGKTLDEIQLDAEEPLEGDEVVIDDDTMTRASKEMSPVSLEPEGSTGCQRVSFSTKTKKTASKRKMWSDEEQAAVQRSLGKFFVLEKLPGKSQIEEARHKEPVLLSRNWVQIKSYIKKL